MRIIILIAVCVVFSGCATIQTAVETIPVSERQYAESYKNVFSTALDVIGTMELLKPPYSNKDKGQILAALLRNSLTARDIVTLGSNDVIATNVIDLSDRTQVDMRITYHSKQQDWSVRGPSPIWPVSIVSFISFGSTTSGAGGR